jgi:hypothetical protein
MLLVLAAAACTEGKTPDCSDPNVPCGPDLDGSVVDATSPEAGGDADAAVVPEAGSSDADADADATLDASDAG